MFCKVKTHHRSIGSLETTAEEGYLEGQGTDESENQGVGRLIVEERGEDADGFCERFGVNVLVQDVIAYKINDGVTAVEDVGEQHKDGNETDQHLYGFEIADAAAIEVVAYHVTRAVEKVACRTEESVVASDDCREDIMQKVFQRKTLGRSRLSTCGAKASAVVRATVDTFRLGCINGKRRLALQTVSLNVV